MIDRADLLLAFQPTGARCDLRNRNAAGVVDIQRQIAQDLRRLHEAVPFGIGEPAGADFPHVDFGLLRKNASRQLRCGHFEREHQDRRAALGLGAVFLVLGPQARGMEGHIGGKRGLPHARPSRDDDEVGCVQSSQQRIQIRKTRRNPGNLAAARQRLLRLCTAWASAVLKPSGPSP